MSKASFPLNAWYAAARDEEVGRDLFSRTICNKPVLLYRKLNGDIVALADMCWHRLLPLSMGGLNGDNVVCGYHGIEYDPSGRCVYMPSQETINPSACVTSYPCVERHKFIWVWLGDPALADPATVPDLHWNDDPEWASGGRMISAECNYLLVVDNLMDLTHETFVHGSSIGNRAVAEAPFDVTHSEASVRVTRWIIDQPAAPHWAAELGGFREGVDVNHIDRWQIIDFEAPATVVIDVGVGPTGSGAQGGDRSAGIEGRVLNTVTPETETTCHYFWAYARGYDLESQERTTRLCNATAGIFGEDEVIFKAQQLAIDANPDHEFYNLNIDAGSMWARKLVSGMVEREAGAVAAGSDE